MICCFHSMAGGIVRKYSLVTGAVQEFVFPLENVNLSKLNRKISQVEN